jgi:TonB family protein
MALLRQYVAGTLTPASQHHVEAHIQACAHCSEVLDGLSLTNLATTDQALSQLQQRLRMRVAQETNKQATAGWQRLSTVAAAILLLVLVGTIGWLGRQQLKPAFKTREVATVKVRPSASPADAPVAKESAQVAVAPRLASLGIVSASVPSSSIRSATRRARSNTKAAVVTTKSAGTPVATDHVAAATAEETGTPPSSAPAPDLAAQAAPTSSKAKAVEPKANMSMAARSAALEPVRQDTSSRRPDTRLITGRIIDQQSGQALPGVTVQVKGTNIGASTGTDGTFSLAVPKQNNTLTINSVGYTAREQKLGSDTTLVLALAADTKALSEVVVVRKSKMPTPAPVAPTPNGGFPAFEEYLKKELKYPEEAESRHLEGTVKLKFTVTANGALEDVKVVSGLSKECDEEAIRLLREGPAWRPAILNGRPTSQTVRVSVPFEVK